MTIPFKKSPIEFDQHILFPTNVFDLLPENHDCYVFESILDQIDTTKLEKEFKKIGQNAYHPRLLIKILIYAYSHSVFSGREIERKCKQDLAFMYISGMNCPNFRVLNDFRKNNGDFFKVCFKKTVSYALELKLISLGHISIDGSQFKASSSKHKAMSYGRLKAKESELCKQIDELVEKAKTTNEEEDRELGENSGYEIPEELKFKKKRLKKIKAAREALEKREKASAPNEEIKDTKQISFADHDAIIMSKHEVQYAYNVQASVEKEHQIIVGQHISQKANDVGEVEQSIAEVEETAGKSPIKVSLDNGYFSGPNLDFLEKKEIDAYVSTGRANKKKTNFEDSDRKLVKSDFEYNEEKNCFICPKGESLTLHSTKKDGRTIYRAGRSACQECPLFERCSSSKKGEPRVVSSDQYESVRRDMVKKMDTDAAKEVYKLRKSIVEPVFGQIKNTGFTGFHLRGLSGVQTEFSLVCLVHNLKKLICMNLGGEVCLKLQEMWK